MGNVMIADKQIEALLLRTARVALNLAQVDAGDITGTTGANISIIESGKEWPPNETGDKLRQFYGISVEVQKEFYEFIRAMRRRLELNRTALAGGQEITLARTPAVTGYAVRKYTVQKLQNAPAVTPADVAYRCALLDILALFDTTTA